MSEANGDNLDCFVGQWKNAWEHHPPPNTKVLICGPDLHGEDIWIDVVWDGKSWVYGNTIFWMPLPELPNAALTGGGNAIPSNGVVGKGDR